ncbi:UDP-N-acetylmuramoyl-L-alanyl-D-glutamate--2,6-diaminopimelate ligase [Aeromicrobium wangtongii]|uniref:UDP-N-acetylmuramoyl-L-alanyl-D-glutamate--2,6-diaminopimelate ligase n=1 Tax=Aeromicrobium wangtongii TaxID=2969247 RepID=A0ABY5MB39_9ACTN|nr:UDP-N-acetylmuramoyl-L-alanyl-D-glutamate--2,6-diaminopimelate ligase [Aeromicrobium wangtongii]MCD9197545.1 UDP-N-acetylmuramoyl-L-alanyl-D-glutamate--2,6-diaminopimelate ligase [Aeromicrobium wangtongii]UUP15037.1 UDP-N-acetylmuramoyl-L-alanyl-D-glutamate--2,6-diaminopimelate ligase [Aeromicrobium wangtongii]
MTQEMRVRPSQTPRWGLAELAAEVGATASGEAVVTGIALNTAHVQPGDLYAALPGARAHGATYVGQAVERGAVAVLTDRDGAELVAGVLPTIVVDQPRRKIAGLSAAFYGHPAESFTTVGITGTQGKTTTTYLAEAALGDRVSAVVGTIGTRIGRVPAASTLTTPEAPQLQALFAVMREEGVEVCAMEVSSHALVQGRVDGFLFDVAVFLNLGRDHLDFHHDLEDYFLAKAALFTPERARHAVINVDDAHGRRLRELTPLPITTFSTDGNAADWRAVNIRPHRLGTDLEVIGPDGAAFDLSVPLPGVFNVSNALAVIAALATAGHDPAELAAGIAASTGVPGRMERVDAGQPFTAIVDYAHKPDAVTAVLSALRPVTAGRLIVVIGAGGDRDHGKRPLMGEAAARHADVVIVTDDNPRTESAATIRSAVMQGAAAGPGVAIEVPGRREAIAHAVAMAHLGDTVVVAGKGHERGQEVDGVVHPFDDREVLVELIGAAS